ncbi:MAG TPA: hypothetical protein DEG69_03990, partial [Flavobacteriaceae bacterium]|nr:hypothetical protein [Flavobacteriaceae bacterium]
MKKNKFNVIIPFYNVEKWIKYCVRSVKAQEYENYHCYLVDDISTDKTTKIIEKEIFQNDKFTLIKNNEKKYALLNIYDTLKNNNMGDDEIIVLLDGDDWFSNKRVLEELNQIYNKEECDMTYGSYIEYPSKIRGKFSRQIPLKVIDDNSFRESEWMSSHLRTFKHWLWKQIKYEDLLNKEGKFYKAAWDLAFMLPMLEMSGHRAKYIKNTMYVYNRQNPLNEDKINHSIQLSEEEEIRTKKKYERLITK